MASHLSPTPEGSEPQDGYMRRSTRARKPRQFDANVVQFPDDEDVEVEEDPEQGVNAEFREPAAAAPKTRKKPQKPTSNTRGAEDDGSDDDFQAPLDGAPSDGESNDGSAYAPSRASSMSNTAILPPASHESVYGHNMSMQHQHQYYNTQYSTPPVVDPQELYGMPQEVEHQVEPASGPARATRPRSKSAAKDPNHVKRPPNAFILYRSYACSANIIPASLRINDHRQISRIIATMWKELPTDERAVWENRAREAKEIHERENPGYRYVPINKNGTAKPKKKAAPRKKAAAKAVETEEQMRERRRCEAVAKAIMAHKQEAQEQPDGTPAPEGAGLQQKITAAMKNTATEIAAEKKHDEELRAQGIEPEPKVLPKGRQGRSTRRISGKSAQTTPSDEGPELHGAPPSQWSPAQSYDRGYHQEYQPMPMIHTAMPLSGSSMHSMSHYQQQHPAGYSQQERHYAPEQHHPLIHFPRRESVFYRETARDLGLGVDGQQYAHPALPSPSRMEAFPTDPAYYQPTGHANGSTGSHGSPVEYDHPHSPPMTWRPQLHSSYAHGHPGQQPSFDSYRMAGYGDSPSDPHFHHSQLPPVNTNQTTWNYSEDR